MTWKRDDKANKIEDNLWLGKTQESIAKEVGVSIGKVSAYHQELEEREGETYIQVRRRNRKLDKTDLNASEVVEILNDIGKIKEAGDIPREFSVRDAAKVISVTARMYDEIGDKHDLARRVKEVAAIVDDLGLDIGHIVENPDILREHVAAAIPERSHRNMTEAREQKAITMLKMG